MSIKNVCDTIYYNVQLTNNNLDGQIFKAEYQETKAQPIVDKPNDYFLAVTRFSIPGTLLPILFFETELDAITPSNVNNGVYSVTLRYLGVDSQAHLQYIPNNLTIPVPTIAVPQQLTNYYFVYSYRDMLSMFNTAFATALAALPGVPLGTEAPYFVYDSEQGLVSLICQRANYVGVGSIEIYLNLPAFQLFESMWATFLGASSTNGKQFRIQTYYDTTNGFAPSGIAITNPPTYVQVFQEYVNFRLWSPVKSIVFTTTQIPIAPEAQPNIVNFSGQVNANSTYRPIITDFEPILREPWSSRTQLQYYVQGQYRLVCLNSADPLKQLDLQLYWADRNNNLFPIYVTYGETVTVKFVFIKKEIYSPTQFPYPIAGTLPIKSMETNFIERGGNTKYKYKSY